MAAPLHKVWLATGLRWGRVYRNRKRNGRTRTSVGRGRYRNGAGNGSCRGVNRRNGGSVLLPEAPEPMDGLLLVQLYVVRLPFPQSYRRGGRAVAYGLVAYGIYRRYGIYRNE